MKGQWGGESEDNGVWKMRKIIVQGFNRVSEARLSTFKGGGPQSSNTCSVRSVELLSKQAIVRMLGRGFGRHGAGGNLQVVYMK